MDVSRESVKGQGFYYVTADEAKTQSINQMSGQSQCSTNMNEEINNKNNTNNNQ